jgi:hypothetical protein
MNTDGFKFANGKKLAWRVVLVLVLAGSVGQAQYYASQDGHLLDANPRLGSMGINNARLDALVPRVNNLYITGNITGGGNFQGLVPYRSPMEFQGTLGSSTLSNFRRDSVGINNMTSTIPARQPFVDFSSSLTGIRQGRIVRSHNINQLKQVAPTPFSNRINQQQNQNLAIRPLAQPNFSLNVSQPRQFSPFKPLGAAGAKPEWLEGTSADLSQGKTPAELTPQPIQPVVPGQGIFAQNQNILPSDMRISPIQPFTNEPEIDSSTTPLLPSEIRDHTGQTRRQEQELLDALGSGMMGDRNIQHAQPIELPLLGTTMQQTINNTQTQSLPGIANPLSPDAITNPANIDIAQMPTTRINPIIPAAATTQENIEPTNNSPLADILPDSTNLLANQNTIKPEKPDYWPKPYQPGLRFKQSSNTQINHTGIANYRRNYESQARQQFQTYMQKADDLLQKGTYYRAANAYSTAIIYDISNGRAHLGKAHALFGAGEYMSSAYFLHQALKLDPKLANTRTDLRKFFIDPKKFQTRLKELSDWQTRSNAPELKFLQGYVLSQTGAAAQGKILLTDALILDPSLAVIQSLLNAMPAEKK